MQGIPVSPQLFQFSPSPANPLNQQISISSQGIDKLILCDSNVNNQQDGFILNFYLSPNFLLLLNDTTKNENQILKHAAAQVVGAAANATAGVGANSASNLQAFATASSTAGGLLAPGSRSGTQLGVFQSQSTDPNI
jgi:hypothetical protein